MASRQVHQHIEAEGRELPFIPADPAAANTLSQEDVRRFNEQGFLSPFDIFEPAAAADWRAYFDDLIREVVEAPDKRNGYSINGYHLVCQRLYDLVHTPRMLDIAEDILGPDLVCWSTHMFCKLPNDPMEVPLHQDAVYWPFTSTRTLTVWLAIDDADDENAAMHFVPGSHLLGPLPFDELELDGTRVLGRRVANRERYDDSFVNALRAGQASIHSDLLLHGSGPNLSPRRRAGLTIRYAANDARMEPGWEHWAKGSVHVRGDVDDWWPDRRRPSGEEPYKMAEMRGVFDGVPA